MDVEENRLHRQPVLPVGESGSDATGEGRFRKRLSDDMRLLENVGIRADVDHRCGHRLLNQSARFHSIHRPSQLKIQQHQIRPKLARLLHRFFARIRDRHDGIA